MLSLEMVKNDVYGIFAESCSVIFANLTRNYSVKCHFNRNTKFVYSDGGEGTEITALIPADCDVAVGDLIEINGDKYEATRLEFESQILRRVFLTIYGENDFEIGTNFGR